MVGTSGHVVVLVVDGEVVEDVFASLGSFAVHATKSILDDRAELESKRRVIGLTRWNGRRQDVAVAILMLETFAHKRRTSGGCAHEEATST